MGVRFGSGGRADGRTQKRNGSGGSRNRKDEHFDMRTSTNAAAIPFASYEFKAGRSLASCLRSERVSSTRASPMRVIHFDRELGLVSCQPARPTFRNRSELVGDVTMHGDIADRPDIAVLYEEASQLETLLNYVQSISGLYVETRSQTYL